MRIDLCVDIIIKSHYTLIFLIQRNLIAVQRFVTDSGVLLLVSQLTYIKVF